MNFRKRNTIAPGSEYSLFLFAFAACAIVPAAIAAGAESADSAVAAYVDLGSVLIPQPQEPLFISVRFRQAMDETTKLKGQLTVGPGSVQTLTDGFWYAGGYLWRFAPLTLGKAEGIAALKLSGAKTRQSAKNMTTESFDFCVGTKPLAERLQAIGDWMMQNPTDLLFVEGYKQRALLSLYEITREQKYLDSARAAAAKILAAQKPQGYWYSGWQNDIYFADTGSALTFLANYYGHADRNERAAINGAFKAYVDLLLLKGDTTGKPFVHKDGSVGIGFQGDEKGGIKNNLNQPYTISTALTGAELFAALYYITSDEEYKWVAVRACDWILDTMAVDGTVPYIWDQGVEEWEPNQQDENFIWNAWPYDTSAYVGEGLIAACTYIAEPPFRQQVAERIRPHVEWLLRTQNPDGSWAQPLSQDQRRSHGVVNLLNWYYRTVYPDPRVARAIRNYYMLLLDPARGKYLNIPGDPVATALAGRALADIIKPGVDCRRWMEN